jgi:fibronectin type 3 domain-containing protein
LGVSSSEIWVFWDAVYGADYYHIYYSYTPDGVFKSIMDEDGSKSQFYPEDYYDGYITNGDPNTKVYLKITAVIGGEESDFSETISATTLDVVKAPTGLWAEAISSTEVQVGWNKVDDADYYYLYRSDSANGTYYVYEDDYGYPMEFDWDSDYSVDVYDLKPGQTIYFKVTAVRDGEESEFSRVTFATTKR